MARNTLSVSMIVKNEERHLGRLLASVATFADEIVVVDTGSNDRTKEIALEHGAKVFDFVWCDDFAKARNASLSHCTKDLVMWLDADDVIEPDSAAAVKDLLNQPIDWDVLYLPYFYHYSPGRKDGKRKMPPRVWRNAIGVKWVGPIHETPSYPKGVVRKDGPDNIEILHHPLRVASANSDRNLRIMKKALKTPEYRENDYILWHIAKEFSNLGNRRQSAEYYERAIAACGRHDRTRLTRLNIGLAKQYRLLGDHHAALVAAGRAAMVYADWREPYCEMAENYFRLGAAGLGEACLALAGSIPRHNRQVERNELYQDDSFDKFAEALRALPQPEHPPRRAGTARLIAGGDVCLARQMPGLVEMRGRSWPFRGLDALLKSAELVMVNLESSTTTLGDFLDKGGRRPYYYRNRPEMLDVLVRAGVNVVTVANNHAMDFGREALEQQLEILDACGIAACGAGRDHVAAARPTYIAAGDLTVAFIGVETETPLMRAGDTSCGINYVAERDILKSVAASLAEARCHADVAIVSPHWGANWVENAPEHRRALARRMIDLGADAILGHSAHILHGVEIHDGRPIVYDMGSLLFDRVAESRLADSAVFELELSAAGATRLTVTPVRLRFGRARLAEGGDAIRILELLTRLSRDLNPEVVIEPEAGRLVFPLAPTARALPLRPVEPTRLYPARPAKAVPAFYRDLKSNVLYGAVPDGCAFAEAVRVNDGLEVLGARIASPARPGRGFVCEVFFRAAKPAEGRWEARLTVSGADLSFTYTHPIAEGIWPPSRWTTDDIIGDRVVVRPPSDLKEGTYQVSWQLVDQDSEAAMPAVPIGRLVASRDGPPGVAGLTT